jgi:hypothetical protein
LIALIYRQTLATIAGHLLAVQEVLTPIVTVNK